LARIYNTFEFVGKLNYGKEPVKLFNYDSGWNKKQLSVSINESQNNGVFIALEGGWSNNKENKILATTKKVFGEESSKIEIPWSERFNQDVVNSIPDFRKTVIDLTIDSEQKEKYGKLRSEIYNLENKEEGTQEDKEKLVSLYNQVKETVPYRYEFLHTLDAVEFIEKNGEKLKGKKFRAKGNVEVSYWNGKFYTNYKIQSLELVDEETPNKLSAFVDLYFTKDVADKSAFKSEKTITYNTYILGYDGQHKKDVFFPYETVFNGSNYDWENPKHKAHYNILDKFMTVKGKEVYHLPFHVKIVSGAEEKEFSEDDLTEEQKIMIEAGFNTLDDFKGKRVFGDRVNEVRLIKPEIKDLEDKGNFSSGAVETAFELDDLDYTPADNSTVQKSSKPEETTKTEVFEFDESDLPF